MNYKDAEKLAILKCISGSHAYGTNTFDSDIDYRGIFIAPPCYLLGEKNVEEVEDPNQDAVLHEIRKFFTLATNCNPNIIELLFVDDKHIVNKHRFYDKIRDNRHLFLSTKARYTFAGYSAAQAHRIKNHRGYLLNPPEKKPERKDFGLPEYSEVPKENRQALTSLPDKFVNSEFKDMVLREKKFNQALKEWNAYQDWASKRNPKRKELEAKYLYDTKHGMHLVRLVNMGREILTTGNLTVYRPEREELINIRNGGWSYDKLEKFANEVDQEFEELEKKSPLPKYPDRENINKLLLEILSEAYSLDLVSLLDVKKFELPE